MEIKLKQYSNRIKNNNGKVIALTKWNKTFLSCIVDYSKKGDFSAVGLQSYFDTHSLYLSLNTIRLKLNRMHKKGIFNRKLVLKQINKGGRSYYQYSFSQYGEKLCEDLGIYPSNDLSERLLLIANKIERRNS